MKITQEIKKLPSYLRTNKIAAVILMAFILIYLINRDIFLNSANKKISGENKAILKIKNRIKAVKLSTRSISSERNSLYYIKNQTKKLKIKLKKAEIMLPGTLEVASLIKNISLSKPAYNFAIEGITIGKPFKYKGITTLPVDISITGGFNKAIEFIKNLNSMKRILIINYVSVKASKKLFPDIKSEIRGDVFSMKAFS